MPPPSAAAGELDPPSVRERGGGSLRWPQFPQGLSLQGVPGGSCGALEAPVGRPGEGSPADSHGEVPGGALQGENDGGRGRPSRPGAAAERHGGRVSPPSSAGERAHHMGAMQAAPKASWREGLWNGESQSTSRPDFGIRDWGRGRGGAVLLSPSLTARRKLWVTLTRDGLPPPPHQA